MGGRRRKVILRYSFGTKIIMKQQIHDTILSILAEKIADGIEGIVKGRTLNYEWYDACEPI